LKNSLPDHDSVTLSADGKTLFLAGQLSFANAKKVHHEFCGLMNRGVEQIDCCRLEHADSTALALLLTAAGMTDSEQRELKIHGLSSHLVSLADVYGIDELLNIVS